VACAFKHEAIASLLLDRVMALDPELGTHIDGSVGRPNERQRDRGVQQRGSVGPRKSHRA
jgi:hypothetical protein